MPLELDEQAVASVVQSLAAQGADISYLAQLAREHDAALATKLQVLGYKTLGSRVRVEQALRMTRPAPADASDDEDEELELEDNDMLVLEDNCTPMKQDATAPDSSDDEDDELALEDNSSPTKVPRSAEPAPPAGPATDSPKAAAGLTIAPPTPAAPPEALAFKELGKKACADGDFDVALDEYRRALTALGNPVQDADGLATTLWADMAQCHLERHEWWDAVQMCHLAGGSDLRGRHPQNAKARLRYAQACMELGLLSAAGNMFRHVQGYSSAGSAMYTTANECLASIDARRGKLVDGSGLADEVERLRMALGVEAARAICDDLQTTCAVDTGRAKLLALGFLQTSDEGMGGVIMAVPNEDPRSLQMRVEVRLWLRACYRSLLFQVERKLQKDKPALARSPIALPGGGFGVSEGGASSKDIAIPCVSPAEIAKYGSMPAVELPLNAEDIATLQRDRYVVVDERVHRQFIERARQDVHDLEHKRGMLRADGGGRAPKPKSHTFRLHSEHERAKVKQQHRGLDLVTSLLWSLPLTLQEALGLELRVPQNITVSSVPTGATCPQQLDAQVRASDGTTDIPRVLTVLLYLSHQPTTGGALRLHTSGGSATSSTRDIEPVPGRLVIFYSQEVAYEVLKSDGERYALTMWLWEMKKDRSGR